ncbi:MAG: hypothetical protein M3245_00540, partial [Actinomycetota bacterium]|nr:hypothetical protein [Actinomycetota bacterium]
MDDRLGTVLALLHRARTTYTSVRATVGSWHSPALVHRQFERWAARQPAGSVARLTGPDGDGDPDDEEPLPERIERLDRFWLEHAARWRMEFGDPVEEVQVRDGDMVATTDPHGDFLIEGGRGRTDVVAWSTQPFEEIWDPGLFIAELWLDRPSGRARVAGREGVVVGGPARPTERPSGEEHIILPDMPDACELVVDAERGILLRLT